MKRLDSSAIKRGVIFTAAFAVPAIASAHPGLPGHTHGFANGFEHPFSGLDHLLAMTAVGLWAAQQGGKAIWKMPLAFLSAMVLGGALGMTGLGKFTMLDQAIATTVLVMGILVATAARVPATTAGFLVAGFALFHGYAHGAEMPATASGLFYGVGFVLATAILQSLGIGMGLLARTKNSMQLLRVAGCVIAVCGIYLIFNS